jgi:hypothetical protein
MKSILTVLTASFVLLASSFTFSSCKDCGKKGTESTDRGGKTSTDGNGKAMDSSVLQGDGTSATGSNDGSNSGGVPQGEAQQTQLEVVVCHRD